MRKNKIILRKMKLNDLDAYYELTHPSRAYHQFNGPYFKKQTESELKVKLQEWRISFESGDLSFINNRMLIVDGVTDVLIGEVSWYWKSEETNWMEIGIVIFNDAYWGKGIGYVALQKWIDHLFAEFPELVRLGLTTWSGNKRMMQLSEKLGMKLEAVYRNARIVAAVYYDSISYGVLKPEWLERVE